MIPKETKKPKIRHAKVDLREKQKLTGVLTHFFKKVVIPKAHMKQLEGMAGWDNPDNLLELRKQLVAHIKEGMLGRKDQEEDIAILAAFVWYNRLEDAQRESIVAEWG